MERLQSNSGTDAKGAPSTVPKWSLRPEVFFFISSIIYFLPLALGWFVYVRPGGGRVAISYHLEVIPAVALALASILLAIALLPAQSMNVRSIVASDTTKRESLVLGLLIALSGLYVLLTPELFSPDKVEVLRATRRGHSLFYNLSAVGILYCALIGWRRNPWLLGLSMLGILLTLYIGHRSTVALAIAGVLYIAYRDRSVFSIGLKRGLAVVAVVIALTLYKLIYRKIKMGNFGAAFDTIADGTFFDTALFGMEPFVTFAHLDFVVTSGFNLQCSNLWRIPLSLVPFTNELLDEGACSYHHQIQPVFFPGYSSGVGGNVWAEFFANFGYAGIPLLVIIVVALGKSLELVLARAPSAVLRAGIILGIIHLTVYIQRNELLGAFVFAKRAILVAVLVYALAWLSGRLGYATLRNA